MTLEHYHDAWTAEVYADHDEGRIGDMSLWLSFAKEYGGPALELAAGTGRVLLELARAGHTVTGLDRSAHMLAVARRRVEADRELASRVTLVEAPMQNFDLTERFSLIYIPARSLQILTDRADQRGCLECCARHLRPGGRLAFDVFNPRLSRLVTPGGVEEAPDEYTLSSGTRVRELGHSDYDLAAQTLYWHARYEETPPGGETTVREYTTGLHYFFRHEVEWMLEACGFAAEALYGDFDRSAFTAQSPEMIFLARPA
jgi:SAM-dependent methyltransferase